MAAPLRPLDRSRIADRILDDLRNQIASGELPRGTRLPSERELALRYGVSGATIREAISGLTALGFVDVRHGSGAYVTAETNGLVASSSARSSSSRRSASPTSWACLRCSIFTRRNSRRSTGPRPTSRRFRPTSRPSRWRARPTSLPTRCGEFLSHLAAAAHNPLLAALCDFLSDLQIRLALELSGRSFARWRRMTAALQTERIAIVAALDRRDRPAAIDAVRAYQAAAMTLVTKLPYGGRKRLLAGALSAIESTRRRAPPRT